MGDRDQKAVLLNKKLKAFKKDCWLGFVIRNIIILAYCFLFKIVAPIANRRQRFYQLPPRGLGVKIAVEKASLSPVP
jgi:hypothetical protein